MLDIPKELNIMGIILCHNNLMLVVSHFLFGKRTIDCNKLCCIVYSSVISFNKIASAVAVSIESRGVSGVTSIITTDEQL